MEQRIKALQAQMEERLSQIDSREKLSAFWQDFLGKKGSLADLMKGLGAVPKEDRPAMGKVINDFKVLAEQRYQEYSRRMEQMEMAARNRLEQVDITLPAKRRETGNLHPITIVKNEMINVFLGMGFEVFEGHWGPQYGKWTGENTELTVGQQGAVALTLTQAMIDAAYTQQWWGGIFVVQGKVKLTKVTVAPL